MSISNKYFLQFSVQLIYSKPIPSIMHTPETHLQSKPVSMDLSFNIRDLNIFTPTLLRCSDHKGCHFPDDFNIFYSIIATKCCSNTTYLHFLFIVSPLTFLLKRATYINAGNRSRDINSYARWTYFATFSALTFGLESTCVS